MLVEALAGRYALRIEGEFDRIEAGAAGLNGGALADALLARFTGEDPDAVLALLETRNDGADARGAIRAGVLRRVTALVRIAAPDLWEREIGDRAGTLLRLLKLAGEGEAGGAAVVVAGLYVRERVRG